MRRVPVAPAALQRAPQLKLFETADIFLDVACLHTAGIRPADRLVGLERLGIVAQLLVHQTDLLQVISAVSPLSLAPMAFWYIEAASL